MECVSKLAQRCGVIFLSPIEAGTASWRDTHGNSDCLYCGPHRIAGRDLM